MDKLQICHSYIGEIEWINNLWCNFGGLIMELNRLEFNILKCLYDSGCTDPYHSITITELLEKNEVSDKRWHCTKS